jgi:hypothetical protein
MMMTLAIVLSLLCVLQDAPEDPGAPPQPVDQQTPSPTPANTNAAAVGETPVTTATDDQANIESQASADRLSEALRRLRDDGLRDFTASKVLWSRLVETTGTMLTMRRDLARQNLELSGLRRELSDLRQFILDHDTYGNDYAAYTKVMEETRRQRRTAALRDKRSDDNANRRRREAARQKLDDAKGKEELEKLYDERGFAAIGQDVYTARSAFFYGPRAGESGTTIQYRPTRYGRLHPVSVPASKELDYATMTISGSILNAANEIRSIGVAFTFFDEHGNQVGAEIVEIVNARPNVPYPFTRKIDMALNRPFTTHSTYVLYADPVTP